MAIGERKRLVAMTALKDRASERETSKGRFFGKSDDKKILGDVARHYKFKTGLVRALARNR